MTTAELLTCCLLLVPDTVLYEVVVSFWQCHISVSLVLAMLSMMLLRTALMTREEIST